MKKNTKITKTIEFDDNNSSDMFLACALHDYILEKDNTLNDYIGFDENENTNYNDFIYSYYESDLEISKKIESYIIEFEKDYDLISEIIDAKVENDDISDSNEFYEQFKEILQIKKNYLKYNQNLPEKKKSIKSKI